MRMISHISSLKLETQKKIGAFIGAIVGDAACLHLEWIYDQNKITKIVVEGQDPAFWPENHCPFFSLLNGKVSCYADQAIQFLDVMFENGGSYNESKLVNHFIEYFGNSTGPYQVSLSKRKDNKYPIEGINSKLKTRLIRGFGIFAASLGSKFSLTMLIFVI